MREHVRGSERYFRTEAGTLTLDWGSNGADYKTLDFSYVAKGKGGNLQKLYGQVRRNDDGETYTTYDIRAGRYRQIAVGTSTIVTSIKTHVKVLTGEDVQCKIVIPQVPNTIREDISKVILKVISGWDFWWKGETKKWDEIVKQKARESFVREVWDKGIFFCDTVSSKKAVVPVGLMNVDIGDYGKLYTEWRTYCGKLER